MGIGEKYAWKVFVNLVAEIAGTRRRYMACEWVGTAATQIWLERSHPAGTPMWINNPDETAPDSAPAVRALARLQHIIDEAATADETDPTELKRRILACPPAFWMQTTGRLLLGCRHPSVRRISRVAAARDRWGTLLYAAAVQPRMVPASGKEKAMTELPADVRDRYRRLAESWRWQPETQAAFLSAVAGVRAMDEGPGVRYYYERADEEGLFEQGTRWLWEAVIVNDAVIAVKQLETPLYGPVRRYWWRSLEDDSGGLTDQPLEPEEHDFHPITREAFYQAWDGRPTA